MRWRIVLGISIGASLLIYNLLPVRSDVLKFLIIGLIFSIVSRTTAVAINSVISASVLINYRMQQGTSEIVEVAVNQVHENVETNYVKAKEARRVRYNE